LFHKTKITVYFTLLFALLFLAAAASASDPIVLTLLHTNDIHGRVMEHSDPETGNSVGGYARIAAAAAQIRAKNPYTLLFDAGDKFSGTALSSIYEGQAELTAALLAGYDAVAIGNHEFDFGLPKLRTYIDHLPLPLLCANAVDQNGHLIADSHTTFSVAGIELLVIGVVTPSTATSTHPGNVQDLAFLCPENTLRALLANAEPTYDLVIVLSHLGLDADRRLAKAVPDIDVIIGGHSHSAISSLLLVNDTVIAQAGQWGMHLGRIDLTLREGRIVNRHAELISLDESIEPNPLVETWLQQWFQQPLMDMLAEEVGFAPVPLERSPSWLVQDCNLGNFVCDAMLAASGADFSVYNRGGLRAPIPAGPITMEMLHNLEPFDSNLVTLTLGGRTVERLFSHMAARGGEAIAGASYTVAGGQARDITIQGEPLCRERSYTAAVSDFLAAGGSQYWMLQNKPVEDQFGFIRDALAAFLAAHPDYAFQRDQRIQWRSE